MEDGNASMLQYSLMPHCKQSTANKIKNEHLVGKGNCSCPICIQAPRMKLYSSGIECD